MELIYFWIDGYKNLNDCGVSLNSKYNCSAKLCSDNLLEIIIGKNENYCTPFDEHLNITTIVGENGSGKSNIVNALSYILRNITLAHKTNFRSADDYDIGDLGDCKYCLVLKDWSGNNEYLYHYTNIKINRTKSELKTLDISKIKEHLEAGKKLPKSPYTVAKFQPFLRIEDDDCLDFPLWNNIFHTTKIKLKQYFYYDRFRLYDTVRNLLELFTFNKNLKTKPDNELEIFKGVNQNLYFDKYAPYLDVYEALQWANKRVQNTKEDNYDITQVISRSVSTMLGYVKKNTYKEVEDLFKSILPNLFFVYAMGEILGILNNKTTNQELKNKLDIRIKQLSSSVFPKSKERIQFYQDIKQIITQKRVKEMLRAYIDYEGAESNNSKLKNILKEKFEIKKGRRGTTLQLKKDYMINIENLVDLPPDIQEIERLKGISKNLYKTPNNEVFDFMGLSTGEQRILRFMADVYTVANLRKLDKNTDFDTNIFIFDEMDLSWHPEWQRKMIYYILDIFKKVLDEKNTRKINIIFTTHSPFILSDMPKNNVIRINKGKLQINDQETFAANIHDLFKMNFFENSEGGCTMGEFAKIKIKEITKKLAQTKKLRRKEIKDLEKEINMIGEPIIKNQLLRLVYSRQEYASDTNNVEYLKAQNARLKKEINKLKGQKS